MTLGVTGNHSRRVPWQIAAMLLLTCAVLLMHDRTRSVDAQPGMAQDDPFVGISGAMRSSVVAIGTYDMNDKPSIRYMGTGFVVHDGKTVVTNAHVVQAVRESKRLDRLRVFFPENDLIRGRPANVWSQDDRHDVALVRFEGPAAAPLMMADRHELALQGTSVGIMGYPIGLALGLVPAVHRGVIAVVVPSVLPLPKGAKLTPELADALQNPYDLYQLDVVVFPGNSGSPMFDARTGMVLGIVNKALGTKTREHLIENPSGIGYAVPARWIRLLIEKSSVVESQGNKQLQQ